MPKLEPGVAELVDRRVNRLRVVYALYRSTCGCPSQCVIEPDEAIVRLEPGYWLVRCAEENGAEVDWS